MDAISTRIQRRYMDVRNEIRNIYQLIFMMRQGEESKSTALTMQDAEIILADLLRQRDLLRERYPEIVRNSRQA